MTPGKLLAETMDTTRDLVHFYLAKIDETHWHTVVQSEGKPLNTIAWNLCHLAWAQNHLVLKACSDKAMTYPWLDHFAIGAPAPSRDLYPPNDEIREALAAIHAASISTVEQLSEEALAQPNRLGIPFKRGNSKLHIINHHLRHEPMHIGHISTLCKLLGGKTI